MAARLAPVLRAEWVYLTFLVGAGLIEENSRRLFWRDVWRHPFPSAETIRLLT
jgi:hypothetical protein